MEWFMRPRNEMHKYGTAECPNYTVIFQNPNSNAPVIELEDISIEEMMQSESSSSSTDIEQEVPAIKKKKVKKVGRKPTPKKMSAKRPIMDASDDFEEPGFEADVEDHGKEFDDVFEDHGNGADQHQENVFETEDHGFGGGNEDENNVVEKEDQQNVVQNEDVSSEEDDEWFSDNSNDGNSDYEEDFGEVIGEYKRFGGYVYENWDEDNLELIDEEANQGAAMASTEANEGGGQDNTTDGDAIPHEFFPGASQPITEVNDSQGGVFTGSPPNPEPSSCGVAPKPWQKKKIVVTTMAEILRAKSSREKKVNKKYVD
ncbi:hypothetical protein POM88_032183 [Heracleum sosnowskyi]|uniref:Uncharacterized protein n=1 Tax=Heracleum sosnowskyi TaxID=360622 RepID=A0AAD8MHB4_9APIA|nr:hypothetical protein POM88_032183 [Heracleum sosnowskyi]